jgi:hypothetical protein
MEHPVWSILTLYSGQRYTIATETTPVPNSTVGTAPLQEYYDHWFNVTESVLEVTGVLGSIAFQPVPKTFSEKAKARGGVRNQGFFIISRG